MFSNDNQLTEFIETFSKHKDVLRNLCNEEKDKLSKEIENVSEHFDVKRDYLIKEANELFEYNTSNFKHSSEGLKYTFELLKKDDPDCNLLKESLDLDSETETFSGTVLKKDLDLHDKSIVYKIYRIRTTANAVAQSQTSNKSNILLLHGTRGQNIKGILKEGFKPSQGGKFGPGVYLTNSFRWASSYGKCFINDEGTPKKMTYLFVNKVRLNDAEGPPRKLHKVTPSKEPTENNPYFAKPNTPIPTYINGKKIVHLDILGFLRHGVCWQDYNNGDQVLNVFKANSPSLTQVNLKDSSQDMFDSEENKISMGNFQVDVEDEKIAVAHHNLVTPAYLIEIEGKQSLSEFVNDILYVKFNVRRFNLTSTLSKELKSD